MEVENNGYSDANRAFLQAFMARGTLTLKEGKQVLAAIFTVHKGQEIAPEDVAEADLNSYIAAAAAALSPFDYEIRSMKHQVKNINIFALVNSASDPLTQIATTRTTEEIFFIKRLLDAMFETHNTRGREVMAITSMKALKLVKGGGRQSVGVDEEGSQTVDRGLTKDEAERTLKALEDEGWFERSREGYYTLSPRALMELRTWLVDTYNDAEDPEGWQPIKFCEACKGIVTIGQRCTERTCNVRLHDICETAYWNSRRNKKCPKCKTEWHGKSYVGQKAETSTDDYLKGKRRSGVGGSRSQANEEVEEEEEEVEEEGEGGGGDDVDEDDDDE